eukprot:TRINITY_DN6967_c0_g1_i2.p1 TRINITY_DN6967_c0_g1~~TRINITY_DN6967_c0_g1_i2.p1  ORF type:complete len:257 (-),score=67.06 TRINITY_DN6967_c0_g1_i2:147-917(-)
MCIRDSNNVRFVVGECCRVPPRAKQGEKWAWAQHSCIRNESKTVQQHELDRLDNQCTDEDKKLGIEQGFYDDLILIDDFDVYRNLPHKVQAAYTWGVQHTQAQWFIKVDDDQVVRVALLEQMLEASYKHSESKHVVLGCIGKGLALKKGGKWAEVNYKEKVYPRFPLGSCSHTVSRPIAQYVASKRDLFHYQGEDTSLGIWLHEAPFRDQVQFVEVGKQWVSMNGDCGDKSKLVILIGNKHRESELRACSPQDDVE